MSLISTAVAQSVKLVATPHMRAFQFIKENKKKEALAFINNYLGTNPNDPQMNFWKAKILNESPNSADRDEALQLYISLSDNFPELAEPHNNLGVIYAAQLDYSRAIHYFELALKANPKYALASENLADVYVQQATKYYKQAIDNDSGNKSAKAKLEKINAPTLTTSPLEFLPNGQPNLMNSKNSSNISPNSPAK